MSSSDSIEQKTLSGGKAYALLSIISQVISWVFTFLVIRLLDPQDYGLMSMASFLTSFIFVFSNLGLGAGVVQRESVNQTELSSVFWFSIFVGIFMAL
ncbi:MAG: oligosaccharide flippase family protein, partial [Kangiellaceae bacterium]|nr:oligosaccharide flippase family protein [Kangiellaceae bacterium]